MKRQHRHKTIEEQKRWTSLALTKQKYVIKYIMYNVKSYSVLY